MSRDVAGAGPEGVPGPPRGDEYPRSTVVDDGSSVLAPPLDDPEPPPDRPTGALPPVVAVIVTHDPGPWFEETLESLRGADLLGPVGPDHRRRQRGEPHRPHRLGPAHGLRAADRPQRRLRRGRQRGAGLGRGRRLLPDLPRRRGPRPRHDPHARRGGVPLERRRGRAQARRLGRARRAASGRRVGGQGRRPRAVRRAGRARPGAARRGARRVRRARGLHAGAGRPVRRARRLRRRHRLPRRGPRPLLAGPRRRRPGARRPVHAGPPPRGARPAPRRRRPAAPPGPAPAAHGPRLLPAVPPGPGAAAGRGDDRRRGRVRAGRRPAPAGRRRGRRLDVEPATHRRDPGQAEVDQADAERPRQGGPGAPGPRQRAPHRLHPRPDRQGGRPPRGHDPVGPPVRRRAEGPVEPGRARRRRRGPGPRGHRQPQPRAHLDPRGRRAQPVPVGRRHARRVDLDVAHVRAGRGGARASGARRDRRGELAARGRLRPRAPGARGVPPPDRHPRRVAPGPADRIPAGRHRGLRRLRGRPRAVQRARPRAAGVASSPTPSRRGSSCSWRGPASSRPTGAGTSPTTRPRPRPPRPRGPCPARSSSSASCWPWPASFLPFVAVLGLVTAVALALGSLVAGRPGGAGRMLAVGVGATLTAGVLHLPWTWDLVGPDARWDVFAGIGSTDGGDLSAASLLRFETGPHGGVARLRPADRRRPAHAHRAGLALRVGGAGLVRGPGRVGAHLGRPGRAGSRDGCPRPRC